VPHVWLRAAGSGAGAPLLSSLDLTAGPGPPTFAVVGRAGDAGPAAAAAAALRAALPGARVRAVVVVPAGADPGGPAGGGVEVLEQAGPGGPWEDVVAAGPGGGGVVVVRPDGHVAGVFGRGATARGVADGVLRSLGVDAGR